MVDGLTAFGSLGRVDGFSQFPNSDSWAAETTLTTMTKEDGRLI
jgi:hypothetical protein